MAWAMDVERLEAELINDMDRVGRERREEMRAAVAAVLRKEGRDATGEPLLDRIIDGVLQVVYNENPVRESA